MNKTDIRRIIKEEISRVINENESRDKSMMIRGIKNVAAKTNRESIINVFLDKNNVESLSDLSLEQLYDLSIKINPKPTSPKSTKYVDLGKGKGHMGSAYTGD